MVSSQDSQGDALERSALIHREIIQLGILTVVAVAAFFLTRAVAASNRDMALRDAAEWNRRGQRQIAAQQIDDAVDSFRRATVRDRTAKDYTLALAKALALNRDVEGARGALLTLREATPEDPDVNLQLARLAAERRDVTEALRFYHNALYAPWPVEQADARRRVRLELIEFLLTHGQNNRALSELLALSSDLPDDAALRLEVGRLFVQAGDHEHAFEQFQRVLRLTPESREALAGAGLEAFELGDYARAEAFLKRLPPDADEARSTREVVDLVLSSDPLANRLGSVERRRRLTADFSYAQARWQVCLDRRPAGSSTDEELALQQEAQAFEGHLKRRTPLEQDIVETGVDLLDRMERQMAQRCGPATPLDRALALIGRRHGGGAR